MMLSTLAASAAAMPKAFDRSLAVQLIIPRVSLRKLITAAAGTDGMTLIAAFDLLLAIVDFPQRMPQLKSKKVPRYKPEIRRPLRQATYKPRVPVVSVSY